MLISRPRLIHTVIATVVVCSLALFMPSPTQAQAQPGATLEIFNGEVGVLRSDGTPLHPAPNGLQLRVGDQIGTTGQATATVSFFEGSRIELARNTTVILRELRSSGSESHVVVEVVFGFTKSTTGVFTNPASEYRVHNPGAVVAAVMRGTVSPFGHLPSGWTLAGIDLCGAACGSVFIMGVEYKGPGAWIFSPAGELIEVPLTKVYEGVQVFENREPTPKEDPYNARVPRPRESSGSGPFDPFTAAGSLVLVGMVGLTIHGTVRRRRR